MTLSELIVKVLDIAANRMEYYDDLEPEVREYAQGIKDRYSELRRHHDFTTAAFIAREEFVRETVDDSKVRMEELEAERDQLEAEVEYLLKARKLDAKRIAELEEKRDRLNDEYRESMRLMEAERDQLRTAFQDQEPCGHTKNYLIGDEHGHFTCTVCRMVELEKERLKERKAFAERVADMLMEMASLRKVLEYAPKPTMAWHDLALADFARDYEHWWKDQLHMIASLKDKK